LFAEYVKKYADYKIDIFIYKWKILILHKANLLIKYIN
jgi:hypothetical protein